MAFDLGFLKKKYTEMLTGATKATATMAKRVATDPLLSVAMPYTVVMPETVRKSFKESFVPTSPEFQASASKFSQQTKQMSPYISQPMEVVRTMVPGLSQIYRQEMAPTPKTTEEKAIRGVSEALALLLPTGLAGKALSKTSLLQKVSNPLIRKGTAIVAKGGLSANILGKGIANVGQGLPYTVAYRGLEALKGNQVTPQNVGEDVAFDLATGAIPIIGATGILKGGKNIVKQGVKDTLGSETVKTVKGQTLDMGQNLYRQVMDKGLDSRPPTQKILEDMINQGKYTDAWKIIDELPDTDTYKEPMRNLLSGIAPRPSSLDVKSVGDILKKPDFQFQPIKDVVAETPLKVTRVDISDLPIAENKKLVTKNILNAMANSSAQFDLKLAKNKLANVVSQLSDSNLETLYKFSDFTKTNFKQFWEMADKLVTKSKEQQKVVVDNIRQIQSLPTRDKVFGKTAEKSFKDLIQYSSGVIDDIANSLRINNITDKDFIRYIQNPKLIPSGLESLVLKHKALMETLYNTRENRRLGKIDDYFPRKFWEDIDVQAGKKQLGENVWVSLSSLNLGSAKRRTGALVDYATDYVKVMKAYAEEAAIDKYGSKIRVPEKLNKYVNEVLDRTKNVEKIETPNASFNYIDEYAKATNIKDRKPVFEKFWYFNTWDQYKRKLETKYPELASAMRLIRDIYDDFPSNTTVEDFIKYSKYIADNPSTANIVRSSPDAIKDFIKTERDYRVQSFIETLAKYKFDGATTKNLNREVDRLLKGFAVQYNLVEKALVMLRKTFYRAQIWGNLSTVLAQSTETTRLPTFYGAKTTADALRLSVTDPSNIIVKYGFKELPTNIDQALEQISRVKTDGGLLKKTDDVLSAVGGFGIDVTETLKNKAFLYAAEIEGMKRGLKDIELRNYVRDEIFSNAYIQHTFNTPVMLSNPYIAAALQYMQYSTKNFVKLHELVSTGQKGKAVKLLGSNATAALFLTIITGKSIETVADKLLGVGVGPTITVFADIADTFMDYYNALQESKETGKPMTRDELWAKTRLTDLSLRNFVPFGNQATKTVKATKVLKEGYDTQFDGDITYLAPEDTLSQVQGVLFGKSSFSTYKDFYANKEKPISKQGSAYIKDARTRDELKRRYEEEKTEQENDRQDRYIKQGMDGDGVGTTVRIGTKRYFKKDNGDKGVYDFSIPKQKLAFIKAVNGSEVLDDEQKMDRYAREGISEDEALYALARDKYKLDDYEALSDENILSNSLKRKKAFEISDKVMSDLVNNSIEPDLAEQMLNEVGVTPDEAEYHFLSYIDDDVRLEMLVAESAKSETRDDWINYLVGMRREIGNRVVLTSTMIDKLYNDDLITKSERDVLKAVEFKDGKPRLKRAFRESNASTKALATAQKKAIEGAVKATAKLVKPKKAQFKIARERRAKIKVKPVTVSGIKVFTSKPISVKNIAQLSSNKAR